jgi:hypothetical protein
MNKSYKKWDSIKDFSQSLVNVKFSFARKRMKVTNWHRLPFLSSLSHLMFLQEHMILTGKLFT